MKEREDFSYMEAPSDTTFYFWAIPVSSSALLFLPRLKLIEWESTANDKWYHLFQKQLWVWKDNDAQSPEIVGRGRILLGVRGEAQISV